MSKTRVIPFHAAKETSSIPLLQLDPSAAMSKSVASAVRHSNPGLRYTDFAVRSLARWNASRIFSSVDLIDEIDLRTTFPPVRKISFEVINPFAAKSSALL